MTQPQPTASNEETPQERRAHLWVTVIASLLAATLGAAIGGFFSYKASKDASSDQAARDQTSFVRQQRQTVYLQATSLIAAVQSTTKQAIYDSLPYSAAVTGDPLQINPATGPGGNPIVALRISLPNFEAKQRDLAGLAATISVVGSPAAVDQYRSLVDLYGRIDGDLYNVRSALSNLPNKLTKQQVLSLATEFADENRTERDAEAAAARFEATARTDLNIK